MIALHHKRDLDLFIAYGVGGPSGIVFHDLFPESIRTIQAATPDPFQYIYFPMHALFVGFLYLHLPQCSFVIQ